MPPAGELPRLSESSQTTKRGTVTEDEVPSEIPSIEQRLARVEKLLRRSRYLCLALLMASLGLTGGLLYEFLAVRGTLRVRRLIVVNERGSAVEIESSEDGDGIVSVHDSMNIPRALLGNSRKGFGTLELYSGAQKKLVSIGGSGSGGQIAVYNNSGKKVIDAQASKTNSGAVAVHDYDGNYASGLFGDRR
jgi:hypothetical protein